MTDNTDTNSRKWIFMGSAVFLAIAAGIAAFSWQSASAESDEASAQARAAGIDAQEQAAFEALIRQYILDNPEIIPEAVDILRSRQVAERVDGIRQQLETPFAGAFAGNPDGDVVLIEFSDFACGFCRQSVPDVDKLLAEDPNIKVVYRELPILSEESNDAAAMALAAADQGKYYAFHKALFAKGRLTEASITSAAQEAGLDIAEARNFIATPAASNEINNNLAMAQRLEFSGTPSWVIGNQVYSGAVGYEILKDAVAKARAAKGG